ncbi:actin interacting protein 1 [Scheffersomyces xylosifermentans]|uniref:actin interacting protein 1 n=1 Tax=Scheffersomyces xylosifermentans TaxID=1304137 RepID=UPI00315D2A49
MSITPQALYPPNPATVRAQSLHISYDAINDRIVYPNGKSIIVRSVDPQSALPPKQFTKHIHTTTAATFAPSGNYVASADESGALKIWDTAVVSGAGVDASSIFEQPNIKSEFQILSGPIKSIAWDADSSRIIAVGQGKDKFGHCFTWDSGNSIGEIQGHSSAITAVDIKPQRPYRAATVSEDKAMVFFNGPPFKFDKSIRGHHTNTVRAVKFSPDGRFLVSAGSDRTIVIYDGKTGEYLSKKENAHEGGIFSISWFKDSSKFVTASADNTLKAWTPEGLASVNTYIIDPAVTVDNQQVGVVVTRDYIISLSYNGNLNYFKEEDEAPFAIIPGHNSPLTTVAINGHELITGGSDGSLFKWTIEGQQIKTVPSLLGNTNKPHSNYVVNVIGDGNNVVTAGWDDKLVLWNQSNAAKTIDLKEQPKQIGAYSGRIIVLYETSIELYSNEFEKISESKLNFETSGFAVAGERLLLTNTKSNVIEQFTIDSGKISPSSVKYAPLRSPPSLIRISPDGKYAAVADLAGKYTLYGSDATVVTTRWAFHSSKVIDAKWTPDSQFVISGGLDTGLFLYSVKKPSKVLKFPLAHQIGVSGVEWISYDGTQGQFVTIGLDGVLKLWKVDLSVYA